MSATLIFALLIPWAFRGVFIGLMMAARRSWISMPVIPIAISGVLLFGAKFSSDQPVFVASAVSHLFFLVFFLGSFLSFMLAEQRKKKNGGAMNDKQEVKSQALVSRVRILEDAY